MEGISLIDVSSEDDLLIAGGGAAADSENLMDRHGSGSSGKYDGQNCVSLEAIHERERPGKMSKLMEQAPESSVSPELKPAKSGKVNLRKSLAWDKAFFTSEGVLNAEELAIISSTFKKGENGEFPAIQEDIRKSAESTSTLDGDSWALENLEGDLFDNLRASIQKSLGKSDKGLLLSKETKVGPQRDSSKKVELSSQNKMKPPNALERHSVSKLRQDGTSRETPMRVKVDASSNGDLRSTLRPPKIATRATPLPTLPNKKSSTSGGLPAKSNPGKTLPGNHANRQSVVASKRSGESRNPRAIPSPKSAAGPHLVYDATPASSSSDSPRVSPVENSRKRSARHADQPPSGPLPKTILGASKSKIGTKTANNPPTRLKSVFKLSSSVSPTSSIDSVVSESSSSTSRTLKHSNSTESLDAILSSSPSPQPSDSLNLSTDLPCSKIANPLTLAQGQLRSGISGNTATKSFRPSGLRLPTPKIGYFDAEKSLVRTSDKVSESGLQRNMSKSTAGSSSTVGNKLNTSKLPSIRPVAQKAVMDCDSPYTQTPLSSIPASKLVPPASLRRLSKPAELSETPITENISFRFKGKMNMSSLNSEDGHIEASEISGVSPTTLYLSDPGAEEQADGSSKASDVFDGDNPTSLSGLSEVEQDGQLNSEPEGDKNTLLDQEITVISNVNPHPTPHFDAPETMDQESCLSYIKEECKKNEPLLELQSIQKENFLHPDNTDGLRLHPQSENSAMVELMGQKISSLSLSETKGLNAAGDSLSISSAAEDLGPTDRTPLAEKPFLLE